MPFNVGETIFAWKHMLKGVDRQAKGQPRDRFLTQLQARGVAVTALLYQNAPQNCQLCGYAMAELRLSEGWIMHACSAISFAKILNNQNHDDWLKTLSAAQLANGLTATSISKQTQKTSLPTAGV
jgi:hypothetical protein